MSIRNGVNAQSRSQTGNLCRWLMLFDEASVHLDASA